MSQLGKDNAFIFRITHIDNLPWLLANGQHCRNSQVRNPNFVTIGDPELIDKRAHRAVPVGPRGFLSDYVPFYFTPFSPMLYKIKTGNGVPAVPMAKIVICASSIPTLVERKVPFVFTDRHAYLLTAQYLTDVKQLDLIDWKLIASRDFKRDANDPGKVERYQAEALIYQHVPVSTLHGLACYSPAAQQVVDGMITAAGVSLKTVCKPDWFF